MVMTSNSPLKLAVVGHTNVGKTSLMRTLTRDVDFGQIAQTASTTRHVEGARLFVQGQIVLELYDTPGLEDPIALYDYLERLKPNTDRPDGPTQISIFLKTSESKQRFEQEGKVLQQLLASDAGLYVIDAREPVLSKYRDELAILAMCGKPLLPVLNFIHAPEQREHEWREVLARVGLHAHVRFDTVAPPIDGEKRLYDNLGILLENYRPELERLITDHQQQVKQRRETGYQLVAELLIDVAACRRSTNDNNSKQTIQDMHESVRKREQRCVEALLRLYAFRRDDVTATDLPLQNGRWGDDLFNPASLKHMGIKLGSGMAAGAAAGAGIDLLTGGASLGAATVLGALIGGTTQTIRKYGNRLKLKLQGHRELSVEDNILRLLALRQQWLLQALEQRGHAALNKLEVVIPNDHQWREGKLPTAVENARAFPEWSCLNPAFNPQDTERLMSIQSLQQALLQKPT
ncbi:GTPase/DUF3482 domain-containing protein [Pseudomonas sp. F1_0610]|uniref:GTPase/DUF3482 domain-containing protein n=1 Tax=Pseudomonas sp. F1_0610 TaxID=3114284 RepID=UPI0039C14C83